MLFLVYLDVVSVVLLCYGVSAGTIATLADRPYDIIWQTPSGTCQNKFDLSFIEALTNAGLTFNDKDRWYGERSTIFNPYTYGSWPYYEKGTPPAINGGIPQLGNLTLHIANVRSAIKQFIPDDKFSGVAVIDMEEWRPLWERNWGWKSIYQTESRALSKKLHKDKASTESWLETEANRHFNEYSRKFMEDALRTSVQLRPNGLWGYYHFPYCYNNIKPITLSCKQIVQDGNDKMKWLWQESTAIYPSVYVFADDWSPNDAGRYMYANFAEGIRVAKSVGWRPVISYTKMKYNMMALESFYSKAIMLLSLRMGADFGIEGTIIWGSDRDYGTSKGCKENIDYIKNIISPYSKKLVDFTKSCSQKRCSGLGRCVHRGALDENLANEIIRDTDAKLDDWVIDERYMCRCKDGSVAKDCRKAG